MSIFQQAMNICLFPNRDFIHYILHSQAGVLHLCYDDDMNQKTRRSGKEQLQYNYLELKKSWMNKEK